MKKSNSNLKKVLIITYYWPPSGGGGVQRWVKFVKYLPKFNIEPIVLTVDSDYAAYPLLDDSLFKDVDTGLEVSRTKSFEPLNLYSKVSPNKEIPYGGFANEENPGVFQMISRFIRGNFFIPDARIGWNNFAFRKAMELIRKYNIDTVITSSPPHSTQLIGLKLKQELGIHWIADMRDPWTDIYYYKKMFHTSLAKKLDRRKEYDVLMNADKIIVVSDSIKRLFNKKITDKNNDKIVVIPNGFDDIDFTNSDIVPNDNFTITYTGTIADNYNIDGFIKALISFKERNTDARIQLKFVGHVSKKYHTMLESSLLNNICVFHNHVDHDSSISFLQKSDSLFLAIPNVPHNDGILTGKLFEYLASQKPVIGVGPVDGDASSIISECKAGEMFNYDAVDEIEKYIETLYREWQDSKSVKLTDSRYLKYTRENLTKKLASLID